MKNKFDTEIQELLKAYEQQPSANCWDKVSSQLDAMQHIPDASQGAGASSANSSAFSQFVGSLVGKVVIGVSSVAMVGGLTYLIIASSDSLNISENQMDTVTYEQLLIDEDSQKEENATPLDTKQLQPSKDIDVATSEIKEDNPSVEAQAHLHTENTPSSASLPENNSASQNQQNINQIAQNQQKTIEKETHSEEPTKTKQEGKKIARKQEADQDVSNTDRVEKTPEKPTIDPSKIPIPNYFTPVGGGYNNYFTIGGIDQYPENNLVIFRREDGKVIYEKTNYRNEWNAENVPDGVYYYIFTFTYQGESFMRRGSVTVKR